MKILYVANDRRAAELATFALGAALPDVVVAWAPGLDNAQLWIQKNRDVGALIVEVESDTASFEEFVSQVRGLGLTAPIVAVSADESAGSSPALTNVADVIVAKDASFLKDLPSAISRSLPRSSLRLLYVGDATLARDCFEQPGSIEVAQAIPGLGQRFDSLPPNIRQGGPLPFDVLLIEHDYPGVDVHAVLDDIATRNLHVPIVIIAESEEAATGLSLECQATDCIVKSRASFQAMLLRLHRMLEHASLLSARAAWVEAVATRERLEQTLLETEEALQRSEQSRSDDATSFVERLARREAEYNETAVKSARERQVLAEDLATMEAALRHIEARHRAEREEATAAERQLEQRLKDALAAADQARHERATAAAAAAEQYNARTHATARLTEIEADLAREASKGVALGHELSDARLALQRAEEQQAAEKREAAARLTEREAEGEARLAQAVDVIKGLERKQAETAAAVSREASRRETLAQQLAEAEVARQRSEERHAAELAAGAARLAGSEKERDARLADAAARIATLEQAEGVAAANRDALERTLIEQQAAFELAKREQASETAAAAARLTESQKQRDALKQTLAEREAAHQQAKNEHVAELAAAAALLVETENDRNARLADAAARMASLEKAQAEAVATLQRVTREAAADRDALKQTLAEREAAHQQAKNEHVAELAAAAARLVETEKEGDARLSKAAARIAALEQAQAEAAATFERVMQEAAAERDAFEQALEGAQQRAAAERQAAVDDASQRQAWFDREFAQEVGRRETIASQLAEAEAGLRKAEEQHVADVAAAAAHLAGYQQRVSKRIAEAAEAADAREARLADVARELERTKAQHSSEMAAVLTSLAETAAARERVERQAALDRQTASEHHAREMAAASALLTEYQVQADGRLGEALAAADALQARLADTAAALGRAEQQIAAERHASEAERHAAEEAARRRRLEFEGELAEAATYRQALERALADQEAALQGACEQHASELAAAAARLDDSQKHAETQRAEAAAHAAQALELAEQRAAAERQAAAGREAALNEREAALEMTLEQAVARGEAAEKEVADRDKRLEDQAARQRESAEAAAQALADVEHRFRLALEAGARDTRTIEQLQTQIRAAGDQLDVSRSERDRFKIEADRVPPLLKQIDEVVKAHRREFDLAPAGLLQCRPNGQTTRVSRALADLLGYDSPESLHPVDFAAEVFESGEELKWMIDRCVASRSPESIDTTWKRKNGSRMIVRLRAVAITPDSIDLAVQDITALRELEEKLRMAQRMEAVARYAAEVAITCDKVLKHVEEEGQQWLAHTDGDAARYHGELLLGEVARAAKFLQQLSVYGAEQTNAPDLVDLAKVLRDFVPVIRRVAGSDIELVLPTASAPFNLDVDAERVERMLVNVAAFGRQRMPLGGRLVFEVEAAVVDRQFVDKYPSVRPGAHVLLTINEVRRTLSPELSAAVRSAAGDASPYPGVDLGTLQALVSDCGGHLWMMAEPNGDMVLKIHLPRRVLDRPDGRPAAKRPDRGRLVNQAAN